MRRRSCWRWCRRSRPGASCRSTTRWAPPAPTAAAVGFDKLDQVGVLYHGLEILGGGATLAGIILGAITVFIIDREFVKAAAFAAAGAVLTFFGLIHAEALGIGRTPSMVISYLGIAVIMLACSKYAGLAPLPGEASRMHGHGDPAAKPAE